MAKNNSPSRTRQAKKSSDGAALKKFRHDVAVLKRKGLVDKKIDARSVTPTRSLKQRIIEFADVLDGRARVVGAPKGYSLSKLKSEYPEARGARGRLVLSAGDTVTKAGRLLHSGERWGHKVKYEFAKGDEAIGKDFRKYVNKLARAEGKLKKGESYIFELYGSASLGTFSSVEEMVERMMHYQQMGATFQRASQEELIELLSNIGIRKVTRGQHDALMIERDKKRRGRKFLKKFIEAGPTRPTSEEARAKRAKYKREYAEKRRLNRGENEQARLMERDRIRQKAYRAAHKKTEG